MSKKVEKKSYNGEHRPIWLLLLFQFISCGVFGFYWVYVVSCEMRLYYEDEKINPVLELLASIFTFGIYIIFWTYKYGKIINKVQKKAHMKTSDFSFIYAVLTAFLLFPLAMCLIQHQLNNLWKYGK